MITDFLYAAANLKNIPRHGWVDKMGIKSPESVADHTYMTAVMSMLLADSDLDALKILQMSLLHDIAESKTGDMIPGQMTSQQKKKMENQAMSQMLETLPEPLQARCKKIWQEFQDGATKESAFVHQIDKLEMALQAKIYALQTSEDPGVFYESARPAIKDQSLQDILDTITSR